MKKLYMKVTRDKYELPIAVADTTTELSKMLGVSRRTITKALWKHEHKGTRTCYRKVIIDEDEEDE